MVIERTEILGETSTKLKGGEELKGELENDERSKGVRGEVRLKGDTYTILSTA